MQAAQRGSINGYSFALWPILPFLMPWESHFGWRELETWHRLLAPRIEVHDRVLRAAATDWATPDIGSGMLLGLLQRPSVAEDRALLALGRCALGADSLFVGVMKAFRTRRVPCVTFRCASPLRARRHRAVGPLLELWRSSAGAEHDVRGEIAAAMARADTEAVLPAIEEYVRTEWNARAASAEYGKKSSPRRGRNQYAWDMKSIDVHVRVAPIERARSALDAPAGAAIVHGCDAEPVASHLLGDATAGLRSTVPAVASRDPSLARRARGLHEGRQRAGAWHRRRAWQSGHRRRRIRKTCGPAGRGVEVAGAIDWTATTHTARGTSRR